MEKEFYLHLSGEKDTFTLNGKIDRIDSDGRAVAIFDYKTGNTTATLQEAVAGLKLQLLTYLLDVEEEGDEGLLPAALMYIYLSGDIKSLPAVPPGGTPPVKDRDNTSGWILSDADTVRRLDSAACITLLLGRPGITRVGCDRRSSVVAATWNRACS